MSGKRDDELGMGRDITRRDFLEGAAVVVGSALVGCGAPGPRPDDPFEVGADWYGPGGVGDYAPSHGNTPAVVRVAHQIYAGRFEGPQPDATDTGERFDLVVVGGGFSGLSAAHHFHRLNPSGRVLILDDHPIFGGEAKRNEFDVDGYRVTGPQGSNDFAVQPETGDPDDYFSALGLPREYAFAEPQGAAAGMRIPLDNFDFLHWQHESYDVGHFFAGASRPWVTDTWGGGLERTAWPAHVRESFRRLRETEVSPEQHSDAALDSMTLKAFYENELGLPPEVSRYYDPVMASIVGLGCDGVSAYWGRYFQFPGFLRLEHYTEPPLMSFPGGNAAIARHFVARMIPAAFAGGGTREILLSPLSFDELDRQGSPVRLRLGSTAVRVEHETGSGVAISFVRDGGLHRTHARAVVMASGGWVNRRVVADLPQSHHEAYRLFIHAPVLVANVALRNWRFLVKLGVSAAIWSGGFGFSCNIGRPMIVGGQAEPCDPDKPIVMTFYAPLFEPGLPAEQQGAATRMQMLRTSFRDYERQIREQMTRMFGEAGFDAARDVAGLILNRWGHAYVVPVPGFRFGSKGRPAPADVVREPFGRIAIGHSELRGHQYWSGAAGEGRRAVEALLERHF